MKKSILFTIVMFFALSASMAFAGNTNLKPGSEEPAIPTRTENNLSAEELSRLTRRVEEIRDMDKSEMNSKERKELRKELKETEKYVKKAGGTIYIGGATLLLIIILIILLV